MRLCFDHLEERGGLKDDGLASRVFSYKRRQSWAGERCARVSSQTFGGEACGGKTLAGKINLRVSSEHLGPRGAVWNAWTGR
jgi:hypothetical protein